MNQIDGVDKYDFTTEVVKEVENAGKLPAGVTSENFIQKIDFAYSGQLPAKAEIKIPVGHSMQVVHFITADFTMTAQSKILCRQQLMKMVL